MGSVASRGKPLMSSRTLSLIARTVAAGKDENDGDDVNDDDDDVVSLLVAASCRASVTLLINIIV